MSPGVSLCRDLGCRGCLRMEGSGMLEAWGGRGCRGVQGVLGWGGWGAGWVQGVPG